MKVIIFFVPLLQFSLIIALVLPTEGRLYSIKKETLSIVKENDFHKKIS